MALFGAPEGISAGEQDIQRQQLHNLSMQVETVKLEGAQLGLEQQKKMMDALSQQTAGPEGAADDILNHFDRAADIALKTGNYDLANKFATTANTMRKNESTIAKNSQEVRLKNLNLMSGLLDGVNDSRSWDDANAVFQKETGSKSPYANISWEMLQQNPAILKKFKDGIITAKDKALTEAAKARARSSDAAAATARARAKLLPAQEALIKARTRALNKTGAKGPKREDVTMATKMVGEDFDITDADTRATVENVSYGVAERALKIMDKTGKSKEQSMRQAVQDAKDAGEYAGLDVKPPVVGSLQHPIPFGKLSEMKGKLQKNKIYVNSKGQTAVWTGAEMKLITAKSKPLYTDDPTTGAQSSSSSEEDSSGDSEDDSDDDDEEGY